MGPDSGCGIIGLTIKMKELSPAVTS